MCTTKLSNSDKSAILARTILAVHQFKYDMILKIHVYTFRKTGYGWDLRL